MGDEGSPRVPTGFRSRELVPVPVLVPGPDITVVVVVRSSRGDARLGREGSARDVHAHLPRFPREYLRESFVGRARAAAPPRAEEKTTAAATSRGRDPPTARHTAAALRHARRACVRASAARASAPASAIFPDDRTPTMSSVAGSMAMHPANRARPRCDTAWPYGPMHAGAQHDRLCTCNERRDAAPDPSRVAAITSTAAEPPREDAIPRTRARGGLCVGTTRTYAAFTAAKCDMSSTYSCTASTADQSSPSAPSRASTACNPASALAAAAHAASVGFAAGTEALTWTTGAAEPPNARTRGAPVVVPVASAAAAAAAASRRRVAGGGGAGDSTSITSPARETSPASASSPASSVASFAPCPQSRPRGAGARGRARGGRLGGF